MNEIKGIQNQIIIPEIKQQETTVVKKDDSISFGDTISNFLDAVNTAQVDAKDSISEIVTGESENLHEAMAKVEEAKISFELMLEIRNKLLQSFQEIQRMQV
ncbi:MAG TPA: flagellar hook-basal body complex protein FliE [Candidatus Marinimicrobia bacterium]|jgi:flagellar hook-basal body complex protein FliE|nr:flagellar hook-basal body complex protein FliE [Candidatus Neomarinimicrobiota bacterium]